MNISLVDALGPFFNSYTKDVINWSKIPFENLEMGDRLDTTKIEKCISDFIIFCEQVHALGFTHITLDDCMHLVTHPAYSDTLNSKLREYQAMYSRLCDIASQFDLKVVFLTDYFASNSDLDTYLKNNRLRKNIFFKELLQEVIYFHPQIDGVMIRIGEADGIELHEDFRSTLSVKTPRQLNKLVADILPVFEGAQKKIFVRTWSLGAHAVGDLIWNKKTFHRAFSSIHSSNLYVSMKYGATDFFRYLPLNPLFNELPHVQKVIELQCRREYEGMGEFPSFVGWEYEKYYQQIKSNVSVVGCYIWCQSGGWAPYRRRTFLSGNAIWNELNTYVTSRIFIHKITVENAISEYVQTSIHLPDGAGSSFIEMLRKCDEVILRGLYIQEFAQRTIYFRRVLIPPNLYIFWHNVSATMIMKIIYRNFVKDRQLAIAQGYESVQIIDEIIQLAKDLRLPGEDFEFMRATLELIAITREILLIQKADTRLLRDFESKYLVYRNIYPSGYTFTVDDTSPTMRTSTLLFRTLTRGTSQYRLRDIIFLSTIVSSLKKTIIKRKLQSLPGFVNKQAMPIDTFFN